MDPKITQEILDDLIPSLEALEAKSSAVLEFLKREGVASDEKLAPYLEQATSASNVRWLGVRVRIERLLSAAEKDSARKQADAEKESEKSSTDKTDKEEKKLQAADKNSLQPEMAKSDSEENSKSSRPESSEEKPDKDKAEKNKNAETARKSAETKSDGSMNQGDKNGDRARTGARDSTVSTSTDQKVA
jgi:hypothetical protein